MNLYKQSIWARREPLRQASSGWLLACSEWWPPQNQAPEHHSPPIQGVLFPAGELYSGGAAPPLEDTWEEFKENVWKNSILILQEWDLEV